MWREKKDRPRDVMVVGCGGDRVRTGRMPGECRQRPDELAPEVSLIDPNVTRPHEETLPASLAMASVAKKYATVLPTVRTLANGTPFAPSVNLAAVAVGGGHGHGHHGAGPRSDVPSKWAGGYRSTGMGAFNKSYLTGACFFKGLNEV